MFSPIPQETCLAYINIPVRGFTMNTNSSALALEQGWVNSVQEGNFPLEFSSNPTQTPEQSSQCL